MLSAVRRSLRDQVSSLGLAGPAARVIRALTSSDPRVAIANARFRREGAPDGLPIPPPDLRFQVAGTTSISWFLEAGSLGADTVRDAMSRRGVAIDDLTAILDFGCGCGRVLRHWHGLQRARVYGTDYSPKLVEWCGQNLPFVDASVNRLAPPLSYDDAAFDLVYAFSVFSHLTEDLQMPWMNELARVLKPGGHLVLSTHGESYLHRLNDAERRQFERGGLVVKNDVKAPGSNTCAAYHPFAYVRDRISVGLELADFQPKAAMGNPHQDLYVFHKP
jgi:SAM-dependent methyltransferase